MAKKKKKKSKKVVRLPQSAEAQIRSRARHLDIGTCYISAGWEDAREASIVVSRKHKQGGMTLGIYLVDLAMRGVKDTFYFFNLSPAEHTDFMKDYLDKGDVIEADYTLVHNIIYTAIDFAEENGFSVHKDFSVSKYILEEDTVDIPLMDIEMGVDGEPADIFNGYACAQGVTNQNGIVNAQVFDERGDHFHIMFHIETFFRFI